MKRNGPEAEIATVKRSSEGFWFTSEMQARRWDFVSPSSWMFSLFFSHRVDCYQICTVGWKEGDGGLSFVSFVCMLARRWIWVWFGVLLEGMLVGSLDARLFCLCIWTVRVCFFFSQSCCIAVVSTFVGTCNHSPRSQRAEGYLEDGTCFWYDNYLHLQMYCVVLFGWDICMQSFCRSALQARSF